jgi:hypothetical protein
VESAEKINSRQQKEIRSNSSQTKERTSAKEKKTPMTLVNINEKRSSKSASDEGG